MSIWIRRAEIVSFGKLHNRAFEFAPGIRVLEAPNESGKSTLAAFLKFCLYGFAGSRNQSVADNEKKLYTPWDGAHAEGTIWIRKDDAEYKITRSVVGNKESLTVTDAATGKPVPGTDVPGVAIFGISEEVFSRTLFLRQSDPPKSKDQVLADQLQNIAVSPEEQISSVRAEERLNKAKNELRGRAMGVGLLPKWEKEEADLQRRLEEARKAEEELTLLREGLRRQEELLETNRKNRERIDEESANLDRWDAATELKRLRGLEEEMNRAENEHATAANLIASRGDEDSVFLMNLLQRNNELEQTRIAVRDTSAELEKAEEERKELSAGMTPEDASRAAAKRKELGIGQICLCACAVIFAVLAVLLFRQSAVAGFVLAGAALTAACGLALLFPLAKRTAGKYGASSMRELRDRIGEVPENVRKLEEADRKSGALRTKLEELKAEAQSRSDEIASGIRSYRMEVGGDFSLQLQSLIKACQDIARLDTRRKETAAAFKAALGDREMEDVEKAAEGAVSPERTRENVDHDRKFYEQQQELLLAQEKEKYGKLTALRAGTEDSALLAGKLEEVRARIADGNAKYAAYDAARRGIEEAADLMKAKIAPQISDRAGLYFQIATGGAYRTLGMDTSLAMTAGDGGVSHDADYLSEGTKDLAALSKRLALTDILFAGEGVPVVLDDAFGKLDDTRLTMTARMLGEAAGHHQIFILSCCDRERKALERAGVNYTLSTELEEK